MPNRIFLQDFHGVSIMKTKPTDGKLNGMTVFISNSTVQVRRYPRSKDDSQDIRSPSTFI